VPTPRITDRQYRALAALRYRIRHFLAFSEAAARQAGLTPQQHQLLLAVRACSEPASIGELAGVLLLRHHSVVGLVDRLEALGHVRRARDQRDRRLVHVTSTPKGERLLAGLSAAHRHELRGHGPELVSALEALLSDNPL
jgi:DNA-binding MarR family transcriptional regulator